MSWSSLRRILSASAMIGTVAACPALAAQGDDPDWPCIQRKVPQLSLGQIWNGPELPQRAADWSKDETVSALVKELAARRVALPQAQQEIRDFLKLLSEGERQARTAMLVQGLFDRMNAERSHVIDGIARYAHRQRDMAARLRQEAAAVDLLRTKPDGDPNELAWRSDRLIFQTRIFQERAQSLTFVCEVPTLIEQRLYALAKAAKEALAAK